MSETVKRGDIVKKKIVSLASIVIDRLLQVRAQHNGAQVKAYAAIIEEHGSMDAMDVFVEIADEAELSAEKITEAGGLLMADGFHRFEGYTEAGKDRAPVNIRYGNRTDALKFAIGKLGRAGLPATNADKRRAAELAVTDPKIGNQTDTALGKLLGVSATLIASARSGFKPEKPEPAKSGPSLVPPAPESGSVASGSAPPSIAPPSGGTGPALQPVTARERKEPARGMPSKEDFLKSVTNWVDKSVADEQDVVALFETKEGRYVFLPKEGGETVVKIVGANGRKMIEVPVVVKSLLFGGIILKFEGDGKIKVEE